MHMISPGLSYRNLNVVSNSNDLSPQLQKICFLRRPRTDHWFFDGVMLFGLMRQAYTWEHQNSLPSVLDATEMNMRFKALVSVLVVQTLTRWQCQGTTGVLGDKVLVILLLLAFLHPMCSVAILCLFLTIDGVSSLCRIIVPSSSAQRQRRNKENFDQHYGVFMLHFLVTLLGIPSTVASLKRTRYSFPKPLDVIICLGVILHGGCEVKPYLVVRISGWRVGMSVVYLFGGLLVTYKAHYPVAITG